MSVSFDQGTALTLETSTVHAAAERTARGSVLIAAPVIGYALTTAILLSGVAAALHWVKPTPSELEAEQLVRVILRQAGGPQILTIVSDAMIFLGIWLWLPKRGLASLGSYFRPVSGALLLVASLAGLLLAISDAYAFAWLAAHHVVRLAPTLGEEALSRNAAEAVTGALAVLVAAPLVEETYFRGVLLRWLSTRVPPIAAALLSALLFGIVHWKFALHPGVGGILLTAELALVGFIAALFALGTRSVWPAIAVHAGYNAQVLVFILLTSRLPSL